MVTSDWTGSMLLRSSNSSPISPLLGMSKRLGTERYCISLSGAARIAGQSVIGLRPTFQRTNRWRRRRTKGHHADQVCPVIWMVARTIASASSISHVRIVIHHRAPHQKEFSFGWYGADVDLVLISHRWLAVLYHST